MKGLSYLIDRVKINAMLQSNNAILESLDKFDESNTTFKNLNRMVKDIEHLQDSVREARSIIIEGFKLFESNNMRQFTPLISSKRHRKLKRFLSYCFES